MNEIEANNFCFLIYYDPIHLFFPWIFHSTLRTAIIIQWKLTKNTDIIKQLLVSYVERFINFDVYIQFFEWHTDDTVQKKKKKDEISI